MLKNYFKTAFRNLKKYKVFSIVNIAGLAIGLCAFWMIALYVADEMSYDYATVNADRIYRVVHYESWEGGSVNLAPTPAPFAAALKAEYPEIGAVVRVDPEGGGMIRFEDKQINAGDVLFADSSIFTVFGYHFLYGDPRQALSNPQSVVLTEHMARILFGKPETALNKTILFDKTDPWLVTGVIEDIPVNSQLLFSGLRSMPDDQSKENWQNSYLYTYLLLKQGTDYKKLEAKLPGFFSKYIQGKLDRNIHYKIELQPLRSIHLHSNLEYENSQNGNIRYIYLFCIVAILILLIAVINYINLTTARSSVRLKETGVRKVIGAGRKQLIFLFLAESVLLTLTAGLIAAFLTRTLLPFFNQISGKTLSLWQFGMAPTLLIIILFSLLIGIFSGIYPAFFLSGFRTIPALKGQSGNHYTGALFRKSLVTFQFVVTICMIAGSCVIYQQIRFVLNKDLGFNKDETLCMHITDPVVREKIVSLKAQLLQSPLILAASGASNPIGNNNIGTGGFNFEEDGNISPIATRAQHFTIDADFLNTLQIKLAKGRNFSDKIPSDTYGAILVNETLVKQLGWKEPIGKKMRVKTDEQGQNGLMTVIGVVKDFNIYSLQNRISPLVLGMPPVLQEEDNLYVRLNKTNIPGGLRYLEQTFRQFDKSNPFGYQFLDENFAQQYKLEEKQGAVIFVFTLLAISIACLGLFGLVTFMAEQRTKEIGIRKVLGAGVGNIVVLLSRDLLLLVWIALLIAIPVAWWFMHDWLEHFAYHISIGWGVFALAGSVTLFIALVTVSLRAIKAALTNPVKSLRSE